MIGQSEMSDMNGRLPMRILVDVSVSPQNMIHVQMSGFQCCLDYLFSLIGFKTQIISTNATNAIIYGNPSGAHGFTHVFSCGRSFSFVLVYLCIYTMFGICICISHALERFFGIYFVYASTCFTHKKTHGLYGSSFSFILVYLCICNIFGSCI